MKLDGDQNAGVISELYLVSSWEKKGAWEEKKMIRGNFGNQSKQTKRSKRGKKERRDEKSGRTTLKTVEQSIYSLKYC